MVGWSMYLELERMWNEKVMTWFEVLCLYVPAWAEENYKELQLGWPIFGLRFESGTFWIWSSGAAYLSFDIQYFVK
jgi:hypothetical protein